MWLTTGKPPIDDDDDLFARPPRSARRKGPAAARITCRVCNAKAVVPPDHPALLCGICLEDLEKTRAHVLACVEKSVARLEAAGAAWAALRDASPARDRWAKVQDAIIAVAEQRVSQAALDATWAKRKAEGGDLAALLDAYEAHCQECDQIAAELDRLRRAQDEVNAAWMNSPGEV